MSDELNKRCATFHALLELKEAVAQDDLKAAQECRDKSKPAAGKVLPVACQRLDD
jgi:hypothetical protein